MIQIYCDICGGSRKFQGGQTGDYRLWFTSIILNQVCEEDKIVPCRGAVDICLECRDKMLEGDEPIQVWDRYDNCLIDGIRESLKRKAKRYEIVE